MKKFRYLSLLAFFALFLLAGLGTGRMLGIRSDQAETPTPVKPPSPELQVKSRPNELQAEKTAIQELPQVDAPTSVEQQVALAATVETEIAPLPEQPAIQPTAVPTEAPPQPVIQKNVLVIGVDDLQAKSPRLESIWLVLYLAQKPEFTLMPVFPGIPAEDGKMRSQDYKLAKLYHSDQAAFLEELKDRGIWWSGSYTVDRVALDEIAQQVEKLVEAPADTRRLDVADVPPVEEDPQAAKFEQAHFAQALCRRAADLSVDQISELDDLFLLFSDHIHSDVPREQAAAELVGMLVDGSPITCEFPSLSE